MLARLMFACLLGAVVAGCAQGGVPLEEPCRYSFAQFGTYDSADGTSSCTMDVATNSLTLRMPGQALALTIRTASPTGYARLESSSTTRHQPGEVYGLVDLDFAGVTEWGGHTTWSVDGKTWRFDLISSSAPSMVLNGSVESLPQ